MKAQTAEREKASMTVRQLEEGARNHATNPLFELDRLTSGANTWRGVVNEKPDETGGRHPQLFGGLVQPLHIFRIETNGEELRLCDFVFHDANYTKSV